MAKANSVHQRDFSARQILITDDRQQGSYVTHNTLVKTWISQDSSVALGFSLYDLRELSCSRYICNTIVPKQSIAGETMLENKVLSPAAFLTPKREMWPNPDQRESGSSERRFDHKLYTM
ncbi:hypothetical protein WMY93_023606 [Mugilogobius chulae]|uniref:Uncharacterized protein n=1 Tax=Mugilogobius chulae TaxID=88201 RepID=A0AAW0N4Q7_9GOBI